MSRASTSSDEDPLAAFLHPSSRATQRFGHRTVRSGASTGSGSVMMPPTDDGSAHSTASSRSRRSRNGSSNGTPMDSEILEQMVMSTTVLIPKEKNKVRVTSPHRLVATPWDSTDGKGDGSEYSANYTNDGHHPRYQEEQQLLADYPSSPSYHVDPRMVPPEIGSLAEYKPGLPEGIAPNHRTDPPWVPSLNTDEKNDTKRSADKDEETPALMPVRMDLKHNDNSFHVLANLIVAFFEARVSETALFLQPPDRITIQRLLPCPEHFVEAVQYRLQRTPVPAHTALQALVLQCQQLGLDRVGSTNPIWAALSMKHNPIEISLQDEPSVDQGPVAGLDAPGAAQHEDDDDADDNQDGVDPTDYDHVHDHDGDEDDNDNTNHNHRAIMPQKDDTWAATTIHDHHQNHHEQNKRHENVDADESYPPTEVCQQVVMNSSLPQESSMRGDGEKIDDHASLEAKSTALTEPTIPPLDSLLDTQNHLTTDQAKKNPTDPPAMEYLIASFPPKMEPPAPLEHHDTFSGCNSPINIEQENDLEPQNSQIGVGAFAFVLQDEQYSRIPENVSQVMVDGCAASQNGGTLQDPVYQSEIIVDGMARPPSVTEGIATPSPPNWQGPTTDTVSMSNPVTSSIVVAMNPFIDIASETQASEIQVSEIEQQRREVESTVAKLFELSSQFDPRSKDNTARKQLLAELREASVLMSQSATKETTKFWYDHVLDLQARLRALQGDTAVTPPLPDSMIQPMPPPLPPPTATPPVTTENPPANQSHDNKPTEDDRQQHVPPFPLNPSLTNQSSSASGQYTQKTYSGQDYDSPMVDVIAPADLPGGYQFEAEIEGQRFLATVPAGGVKQGETFTCYMKELESFAYDIPVGRWKDSIHDCLSYDLCDPVLWNSFFCPLLLLAQVQYRLNLDFLGRSRSLDSAVSPRTMMLITIGFWFLINAGLFIGYNLKWSHGVELSVADWAALALINGAYFGFAVFVTQSTRYTLREKFLIREQCCNDLEDVFCAAFCMPCTISQMARHTANYNEYEAVCCSKSGLPDGAWVCQPFVNKDSQYLV